jgi:gas vesicle protein
MFRFIIGLVTGVAIGAAAASMSQGQSGQDLRAEFDRFRNDLQQGDFDAFSARLESRLKELQSSLEARFTEFQAAVEEAAEEAEDAAEEAEDAAEEAAEDAEEAANA